MKQLQSELFGGSEPSEFKAAEISMETGSRLRRSITEPIREGLSWDEMWRGPDNGLIWCWERGRQYRVEDPERCARAERGELPLDGWKGGIKKKLKLERKAGTLKYLATWQGMRGEDLDIDPEAEYVLQCTKTGQIVVFSSEPPPDEELEDQDGSLDTPSD